MFFIKFSLHLNGFGLKLCRFISKEYLNIIPLGVHSFNMYLITCPSYCQSTRDITTKKRIQPGPATVCVYSFLLQLNCTGSDGVFESIASSNEILNVSALWRLKKYHPALAVIIISAVLAQIESSYCLAQLSVG